MDSLLARDSPVPTISNMEIESTGLKPTEDQYFLLYLIMGTYFGPDMLDENPKKCVFQRLAENLPSYSSDKLSNTQMKLVEVERIYYYVIRKADKSVVVNQAWLNQFFQGKLSFPVQDSVSDYPQFPDLFPPQLHSHSRSKNLYESIKNIVFIHNPDVSYFRPEIVERFKKLTGLEDFVLDKDEAMFYTYVSIDQLYSSIVQKAESNGAQEVKSDRELAVIEEPLSNGELAIVEDANIDGKSKGSLADENDRKNANHYDISKIYGKMTPLAFEPGTVFFPSPPTQEDWENIVNATKKGSAVTGTAAMGNVGPVVGLLDIGECEDSYLFRVSLPGVVRDQREFGCEVESDGRVLVRGMTTTGERKVKRYSQEFEMQTQNLCPPGEFSVSFNLPGPVDPQQFSGNFGTDGILEGIVIKASNDK